MHKVFGVLCLLIIAAGLNWSSVSAAESTESADSVPILPAGFAVPEKVEDAKILKYAWYGRLADFANVYAEPSLSAPVVRNVGDGYLFATIVREVEADGQRWYQINPNEYVLEADISITQPSEFQGVRVMQQPERPFGWIVSGHVRPSLTPGGEPHQAYERMVRYDFFEVFAAVQVPEEDKTWIWYQVGDDKWIRQTEVSLVDATDRHHEVPDDAFWVEVDLYEQTFAAYEGSQMVYASLVSSGLNQWPTREGLFQVTDRFERVKMSGAYEQPDYYFIEDVPYTMYFDLPLEIALHGAYWHDGFGYKASHGCVNLPPRDSEWLYYWSAAYDGDLWVEVHTSDPNVIFRPPVEVVLAINAQADRRLVE